jgi:hypothetical protein
MGFWDAMPDRGSHDAPHDNRDHRCRQYELQRDWAREKTAAGVVEIVLTERLLKA